MLRRSGRHGHEGRRGRTGPGRPPPALVIPWAPAGPPAGRRRHPALVPLVVLAAALAAATGLLAAGTRGVPAAAGTRTVARLGPAVEVGARAPAPAGPAPAPVPPAVLGQADAAFSLRLLAAAGSADPAGDTVVDAAGASEGLALLALAGRGATAHQIEVALGTAGIDPRAEVRGWGRLVGRLGRPRPGGADLTGAVGLWTQDGLPLHAAYLAQLRAWAGAGVWQVDLAGHPARARAAIDRWAAGHTGGAVPGLLGPGALPAGTAMVLADADRFVGAWSSPFSPATVTAPFDGPGGPRPVPYLAYPARQPPLLAAAVLGPGAPGLAGTEAVQLPYRGGRMAALVVLPAPGVTVARLLAALGGSGLNQVVGALRPLRVALWLPELHLTGSTDLVPALRDLGVTTAFGPRADFGALTPAPLRLGWVRQGTALSVTPWGTAASGATAAGGVLAAYDPQLSVRVDRPFLFVVRDTVTGAVLVAAAVSRP